MNGTCMRRSHRRSGCSCAHADPAQLFRTQHGQGLNGCAEPLQHDTFGCSATDAACRHNSKGGAAGSPPRRLPSGCDCSSPPSLLKAAATAFQAGIAAKGTLHNLCSSSGLAELLIGTCSADPTSFMYLMKRPIICGSVSYFAYCRPRLLASSSTIFAIAG